MPADMIKLICHLLVDLSYSFPYTKIVRVFGILGNKVIVRIDSGEDIVKTLKQLCKNLDIKLGSITGIGATDKATIGLFERHGLHCV